MSRLRGTVSISTTLCAVIGDDDVKIVRGSYRRVRGDQLADLADRLDGMVTGPAEPSPKREQPTGTEPQREETDEGVSAGGTKSHRSDLNRRPLDYESRALPLSYGGGPLT